MAKIETGVDKLVKLINLKKKITLEKAAKFLGVSTVVVEEWANFLEDDGVISIEYKFSNVYLVERKISQEEFKKKTKEFSTKQDAFVRKVETALSAVELDTEKLDEIKTEFRELSRELGKEVSAVKTELEELEHYEKLKKNLDQQILLQQQNFRTVLEQKHNELIKEEERFKGMIKQLNLEEIKIDKEEKELKILDNYEKSMELKLNKIDSLLELTKERILADTVKRKLGIKHDEIAVSVDHLQRLRNMVESIKIHIGQAKKETELLVEQSKQQEKDILVYQEKILQKLLEKRKQEQNKEKMSAETMKKFEEFFKNKTKIGNLINKIELDKKELKSDLDNLITKTSDFDLSKHDVKKYIQVLETQFREIEKKRFIINKELGELTNMVQR